MNVFYILLNYYLLVNSGVYLQVVRITDKNSNFLVNFNVKTLLIPITVESLNESATVTCSFISSQRLFISNGSFGDIQVSPTNTTGDVTFSCLKIGLKADFHCHLRNRSATSGNHGTIKCSKAPVVGIAPVVVSILKQKTPFIKLLRVQLSEPVVENAVKLNCLQQASNGITVSVGSVKIEKGFSSQTISVQITSFGNGDPTTLSCVAQSIGGSQYKFSNSQGQSALLIPTDGKVWLYPQTAYYTSVSFQLSLYVNEIIDDLSMLCYVETATSEAYANILLNNTKCTTSEQSNVTTNSWVISPTNVDFKLSQSSSLQRTLYLTRASFPNASEAGTVEIVIVRCCNPATYDPAFFGAKTSATINVLLPNAPIAISENNPLDDSQTVLPNPIFSPVPPCPCDVTQAVCDLGCCCDSFCPEHQPVPCFTGAFGGDLTVVDPRFCGNASSGLLSSTNYPKEYLLTASNIPLLLTRFPGFHQLRCVVADNGAVLGYVYPQTYIARNEKQLISNHESSQKSYSPLDITDSGVRQFNEPNSPMGDGYREGDALRLVRQVVSLSSGGAPIVTDGPENFPLMLPDPISCDLPSGSTVDYLAERKTYQCPITMDEISCQAAITTEATLTLGMGPQSIVSRLSSRAYLIADDVLARLSQSGYQLRARGLHNSSRAPTIVNYYCLATEETSTFSTQSDSTPSTTQPSRMGFFDQECTFDNVTLLTTCVPIGNVSSSSASLSSTPCSWSDGYGLAPAISLANGLCGNVVLRVDYRFFWASGSITNAEADVYLSDIPTNSTQTYNQIFTVTFTNQLTSAAQTEQSFPSSGRFGYDLDAALITGTIENSNADNFTVSVEQIGTRVPGIVKPGADYLCGNAEREPFRFRSNAVGACRVNLNLSAFEDCIRLRSLLVSQLNQYVPNSVVAVYGSPSTTASQDWVIVQRESAEINYTSPLENSFGTCDHVPSGVLMDVFYAVQGKAQGQPIWQIIGAHVSYSYSTWTLRMKPKTENSEVNLTAPSSVNQAFYITISIAYTQVSTDWSDAIIRSPNASERRTLDIANERACRSDGCWKEIFYAWNGYGDLLSLDQGALTRTSYEVAAALIIGAITVTLMIVTRTFF